MRAEVISIGTELLLGDITDTNATFIAQALRPIGLDLIFRTTVGDNQDRIASAIDIALGRVDIVITTGGLGPTVDDVTREAIAQATGRELEFHPILFDQIAERFRRFDVTMTENNRRQAFAPRGAQVIENPVGTAPIFVLETERGTIMTLPGVPREMQWLLENELAPWLTAHINDVSVITSLTLRTAGVGESQIDAKLADLMTQSNPTVGLAAHAGQTDIRITVKAATEEDAQAQIAPVEQEIRRRVGEWVYGSGSETVEDALVGALSQRRATLAVTEHGTGGLLAHRLTEAGANRQYVAIHHETLTLATPPLKGAAEKAAASARLKHRTEYGIAALMVATGGGREKETDVAVAVASTNGIRSRHFSWRAERDDASIWVTTHCMALLLRTLRADSD